MSLTPLDKNRINITLRTSNTALNYTSFFDKKTHYTESEVTDFLASAILTRLQANPDFSSKLLGRYFYAMNIFIGRWDLRIFHLEDETILKLKEILSICKEHESFLSSNLKQFVEVWDTVVKKYDSLPVIKKEEIVDSQVKIDELKTQIIQLKERIIAFENKEKQQLRAIKNRDREKAKLLGEKDRLERVNSEITNSLISYQKRITYLEDANERLDFLLNEMDQKLQNFQQQNKQLTTSNNESQKEYQKLQTSLLQMENKVLELENLRKLSSSDEVLEQSKVIFGYQDLVQKKEEEIQNLKRIVEKYKQKQQQASERTKMYHDILPYLYTGTTLNQLVTSLQRRGYSVTAAQVYPMLVNFGHRFSYDFSLKEKFPEVYKICSASYETMKQFQIPIKGNEKCMQFFFESDTHFGTITKSVLKLEEEKYNYCMRYKIPYILHLGDFFDTYVYGNAACNAENLLRQEQLVKSVARLFPRDNNISNIVMGGNHDEEICKIGFNPIATLALMREDYYDNGYTHSRILIGDQNAFMLHHYNAGYLKDLSNINNLRGKRDTFYQVNSLSLKDTYMDFFGHFHIKGIDTKNALCSVPSLTRDQDHNGAWHVQVYFNEKEEIDYMILIPLLFNDSFTPKKEIVFDKKLKKNNY